ncbi:MAG: LysM peptidoglycan-binding domain-containing protein [Candidatus Omnitrophica bacterium]|nr:LysM peptidoglycan-binding domain-containing protein [Candidatus Omnitrophota bacterium]
MKKKIVVFCIGTVSIILLSGCATTGSKKEIAKNELELIDIKMKQLLAISETSLELSRKAEETSNEALRRSQQAEATSEKALDASNKAIEASNKAIEASNEAKKYAEEQSQKAIDASNTASKTAIEYADKAAERAIQAANEAVKAANLASEKAIAVANQTMAEVNRLRATIKMQEEVEPILKEEPQVVIEQKTHIVKNGETLSTIASKYYKDSSRWKDIYNANRNILKNPDVITPGLKLVIP